MSSNLKFSNLGQPSRIWTVSAIHGQLDNLVEIHKTVFDQFTPGDRLVYTGNYLGGAQAKPKETLDEILFFRRTLLARPGILAEDFVYLRGVQEELWTKMLQLPYAPDPARITEWMAAHYPDMDSVLRAYGSSLPELCRVAREGVMNLTRWSTFMKNQMRAEPGHEMFFSVLRRAAFTENNDADNDNNLLFVHAGVNTEKPLDRQEDSFWWASRGFNAMETYHPFKSVVRGFDPEGQGVHITRAAISLDGGCGYGGRLVCARLSNTGDVQELIAA
jgi:hypothetical protein